MGRKAQKQLTPEQKKIIASRIGEAFEESKRKGKYKSQSMLATDLGISRSSMNRMFIGDESDNSYTLPNLIALSDALDVRIDYLLGGDYKYKDLSIEDISKKTNLSEKSVDRLMNKLSKLEIAAVDEIICSIFASSFLYRLGEYIYEINPEMTIDFNDNIIHVEEIYKSLLSSDIEGIKTYSDYSINSYKAEIARLEKENSVLDKKSDADAPIYWKNVEDIKKYSRIIDEYEFALSLENELGRPITDLEMKSANINFDGSIFEELEEDEHGKE